MGFERHKRACRLQLKRGIVLRSAAGGGGAWQWCPQCCAVQCCTRGKPKMRKLKLPQELGGDVVLALGVLGTAGARHRPPTLFPPCELGSRQQAPRPACATRQGHQSSGGRPLGALGSGRTRRASAVARTPAGDRRGASAGTIALLWAPGQRTAGPRPSATTWGGASGAPQAALQPASSARRSRPMAWAAPRPASRRQRHRAPPARLPGGGCPALPRGPRGQTCALALQSTRLPAGTAAGAPPGARRARPQPAAAVVWRPG